MRRLLTLACVVPCLLIAQTATFPSAIVTDNQLRVAANNVQTTLTFPITTSSTTFLVANATGIAANSVATIDNEKVAVCGVAGTTISIGKSSCPNLDGRGFDSTTTAIHASGAAVYLNIDAWFHNSMSAEVKAIETALGIGLTNVGVPNPLTVNRGGIGAQTLTGIAQGNGTAAMTAVAAPSEGQELRRKYNAGGTPAYEFFSPAMPTAADLNFAAQTPGGSITPGNNSITFSPVPQGVNGADAGHLIYVSNGTGTPEACTINGGAGTAGQTSGVIILNCANTHTGAWTASSASGGIQEAICYLPSGGGTVWVTTAVTLLANVGPCGKWPVSVLPIGTVITYGGFTVIGTSTSGYYTSMIGGVGALDPRSAWLATIGATFGGAGNTTREVGVNGLADAIAGSAWGEAVGVFGHVTSASNLVNAVGGSFEVRATGAGTVGTKLPLWGINTINEDGAPLGANYANVLLLNELDFNVFNTSTKVLGLSIGGNGSAQPASSLAYICNTLGVGLHWDNCFVTLDGVSPIGLQLGTVATGNSVASQQIILFARNGSGVAQVASMQEDSSGNTLFGAPTSHNFSVTGTSNAVKLNAAGIQLAAGGFYSFGVQATGAVTATLGTNAPAGVATTPYTWLKVQAQDGTTGYVPMWH